MDQDRRKAFRCNVSTEESFGILHGKWGNMTVRVVEQSRNGFGVAADQPLDVKPDQQLSLSTEAGCWDVSVIHIRQNDEQIQVGLNCLRERRKPPVSLQSMSSAIALFLFIALGAACLGWICSTHWHGSLGF